MVVISDVLQVGESMIKDAASSFVVNPLTNAAQDQVSFRSECNMSFRLEFNTNFFGQTSISAFDVSSKLEYHRSIIGFRSR